VKLGIYIDVHSMMWKKSSCSIDPSTAMTNTQMPKTRPKYAWTLKSGYTAATANGGDKEHTTTATGDQQTVRHYLLV
jgi:hypothetical protein